MLKITRQSGSLSLVLLAAALYAPACGGSQCPDGFTVDPSGGCVPAGDAGAVDARPVDAGRDGAVDSGPRSDMGPLDMGTVPDVGVDRDADGSDGCVVRTYYRDADGDGRGDPAMTMSACVMPAGYVSAAGDCNDGCPTCFDGAVEICDGLDNDCDAATDEGVLTTYFRDADSDGHGVTTMSMMTCAMPVGYVASSDDCDDANGSRAPGMVELCDAIDNDCDGAPDDGLPCVRGATVSCATTCGSSGTGACSAACALPTGTACAAPAELCNDRDDDCDTLIDEGTHAMGPRRDLGAGISRVVVLNASTGLLALYNTAAGIRGRRFDAAGVPTGSELTITTTPAAFAAVAFGSQLLVTWIASDNLYATVLDASTLVPVTATTAVITSLGGFTTRISAVVAATGVTFVYFSGSGIYALSRGFPSLGGASSQFLIDTPTQADFDLAAFGSRGYVAYTTLANDIQIRSFGIGGAFDATVSATVTTTSDPERAPALFVGDVGGGVIRLGVAYDRRAAGALARIRLSIYDVAAAGGLTIRDSLDVLGTTTGGGFTTPNAAVEGTPLDVTWAGGRWVVGALRSVSGTISTWGFADVTERMGSAPIAVPGTVESTSYDNRSISIAPGVTGRVLFLGSRTDGVTRAYLYGCGT